MSLCTDGALHGEADYAALIANLIDEVSAAADATGAGSRTPMAKQDATAADGVAALSEHSQVALPHGLWWRPLPWGTGTTRVMVGWVVMCGSPPNVIVVQSYAVHLGSVDRQFHYLTGPTLADYYIYLHLCNNWLFA